MKKTLSVLAAFGFVLGMSGMAMAAGTGTAIGTMTTTATLVDACTMSATPSMAFGSIAALVGSGDKLANTNGTLSVACTTGSSPLIWSGTSRILTGPSTGTIAFNLSQTSGAVADDLPVETGVAQAIAVADYTPNGSNVVVPLYGRISEASFIGAGKIAGAYTAAIVVSVNY